MKEKRKFTRIDTHIVSKITFSEDRDAEYVYIENLSVDGIGVVSINPLCVGTSIQTDFFIPGTVQRLSPKAAIIHTAQKANSLYYSGIQFTDVDTIEQEVLRNFVNDNVNGIN